MQSTIAFANPKQAIQEKTAVLCRNCGFVLLCIITTDAESADA
jgi:hypothetical protein